MKQIIQLDMFQTLQFIIRWNRQYVSYQGLQLRFHTGISSCDTATLLQTSKSLQTSLSQLTSPLWMQAGLPQTDRLFHQHQVEGAPSAYTARTPGQVSPGKAKHQLGTLLLAPQHQHRLHQTQTYGSYHHRDKWDWYAPQAASAWDNHENLSCPSWKIVDSSLTGFSTQPPRSVHTALIRSPTQHPSSLKLSFLSQPPSAVFGLLIPKHMLTTHAYNLSSTPLSSLPTTQLWLLSPALPHLHKWPFQGTKLVFSCLILVHSGSLKKQMVLTAWVPNSLVSVQSCISVNHLLYLLHASCWAYSLTLRMEATCFSEMSTGL